MSRTIFLFFFCVVMKLCLSLWGGKCWRGYFDYKYKYMNELEMKKKICIRRSLITREWLFRWARYTLQKIKKLQNFKLKIFYAKVSILCYFFCCSWIWIMWCSRCAFPNTPKFQQVWGKGHIVSKDWVENCHSKRRRLPWRRLVSLIIELLCETEEFLISCYDNNSLMNVFC